VKVVGEHLEVALPSGMELRPLDGGRITIGRHTGNDIVVTGDTNASRLHAVLERLGPGWCVQDLGSRNGTFVNGARISGSRALQHGDEIRVGTTRLVYRTTGSGRVEEDVTRSRAPTPMLTPREREVLVALCRPVFAGDVLGVPASTRHIAAELFVGDDAVKQHLLRLYDKFDIPDTTAGARRVQLAREAVLRGAVSRTDTEVSPGGGSRASQTTTS
jgi:pSer/pThr/pTyr-binding forkhead associated (FHA) protein